MSRQTHEDVVHDLADELDLPVWAVRSHGRFYGRHSGRCTSCDGTRTTIACRSFKRGADMVKKRLIREYSVMLCPECNEEMETYGPVEVVKPGEWEPTNDDTMVNAIKTPEVDRKVKIEPCGCIIEEAEYIGDLDREQAKADARDVNTRRSRSGRDDDDDSGGGMAKYFGGVC